MLYYSQNFEDVYLWRCFERCETGFYIDVGAYDPVRESVTKIFYDVGWSGINLEPSSTAVDRFALLRPRDINLNKLAWDFDDGDIDFFEANGTGRSTAIESFRLRCQEDGLALSMCKVEAITLDSILADVQFNEIEFLKIDAEGAELKVLSGLSLDRYRPKVILLEAVDPRLVLSSDDPAISSLLVNNGYHLVLFDGINKFWCANEHKELDRCFELPPGSRDGIRPYQIYEAQERARIAELQLDTLRGIQPEPSPKKQLRFLLVAHASPGLQQDQQVVASLLTEMGHVVETLSVAAFYFQQNIALPVPLGAIEDINVIMFEHVFELPARPRTCVLYVNPEWLLEGDIKRLESGCVDILLAKSRDAEIRLSKRFPKISVVYTGFASLPLAWAGSIRPDYGLVLHARGHASQKGTDAVLKAYASDRHGELPCCVCTMRTFDPAVPSFVSRVRDHCLVLFRDIDQAGFDKIARKRGVHLCPSEREGFGHYIFGPMSSGAIVVTCDAPPMNEIVSPDCGILIEVEVVDKGLYCDAVVTSESIKKALKKVVTMNEWEKLNLAEKAVSHANAIRYDFEQRFKIFVDLLAYLVD